MELALFILVGFLAQLVDGALGMAYGVISTSILLGMGVPPVTASASVHAAEVFTTGVSSLSHHYYQNIDRRLLLRLAIPGCLGAILGATFLAQTPGGLIRPFVAMYLLFMAVLILRRAIVRQPPAERPHRVEPLGFFGALLDTVGGGGWGPVVSSTLIARGRTPRYVIGSVNVAEFFVTVAASATFAAATDMNYGIVVLGLLIGGVMAAPLAGYLTSRLPHRPLMGIVGVLLIILSIYNLRVSLPGLAEFLFGL